MVPLTKVTLILSIIFASVDGFSIIPALSSYSVKNPTRAHHSQTCQKNLDSQIISRQKILGTAFINSKKLNSLKLFAGEDPVDEYDDDEYDEDYYDEEDDEENDEENDEEDVESEEDKEWIAEEKKVRMMIKDLDEATEAIKKLDVDEVVDTLSPEDIEELMESDDVEAEALERAEKIMLTEKDLSKVTEEDRLDAASSDDLDPDDIFPKDGDWIYGSNSTLKQKDFLEFEEVYEQLESAKEQLRTGAAEIRNIDMIDDDYVMMNVLDEETRTEILNLDDELPPDEEGDPEETKLHEQRRRLIYDLDFNITNVFLASFKHNPNAPVILEHWMWEMRNWTRYEYVRQNNFNFTWDDVDNADTVELEEYWKGAGTDGIPSPSKNENPNIVEWDESPLNYEEEYMLALETWMDEVYKEDDDINLDDEDLMPSDNPAAPEHGVLENDEIPPELKDVEEFEEKYSHMSQEWRNEYVKRKDYEVESRLDSEFRGHLVIACSPSAEDLKVSEELTLRMEKEFGEKVFVETRVVGHAKPEDYLYEIWLESWEIELLHSKRRAVFQRDWNGPRDMSEEYIDELVSRVDFYISDDYRYSFLLGEDGVE